MEAVRQPEHLAWCDRFAKLRPAAIRADHLKSWRHAEAFGLAKKDVEPGWSLKHGVFPSWVGQIGFQNQVGWMEAVCGAVDERGGMVLLPEPGDCCREVFLAGADAFGKRFVPHNTRHTLENVELG